VEERLTDYASDLGALASGLSGGHAALWFVRAIVGACALVVLVPRPRSHAPVVRRPRWRDRGGGPSPLATAGLIAAFCGVSFIYACLYVLLWR
jgi:hypothetical protein